METPENRQSEYKKNDKDGEVKFDRHYWIQQGVMVGLIVLNLKEQLEPL